MYRFQCHHGVPASRGVSALGRRRHRGFNATTAFLLRFWEIDREKAILSFNATTAFLLR
jgi:hypothetical protein